VASGHGENRGKKSKSGKLKASSKPIKGIIPKKSLSLQDKG
jgi:hypothetical protein